VRHVWGKTEEGSNKRNSDRVWSAEKDGMLGYLRLTAANHRGRYRSFTRVIPATATPHHSRSIRSRLA